jgi:hypothetical protein
MKHNYAFIFEYGGRVPLMLDAGERGGETRFVNHDCKPNCSFERRISKGRLYYYLRAGDAGVEEGAEFTADYGNISRVSSKRDYGNITFNCDCASHQSPGDSAATTNYSELGLSDGGQYCCSGEVCRCNRGGNVLMFACPFCTSSFPGRDRLTK